MLMMLSRERRHRVLRGLHGIRPHGRQTSTVALRDASINGWTLQSARQTGLPPQGRRYALGCSQSDSRQRGPHASTQARPGLHGMRAVNTGKSTSRKTLLGYQETPLPLNALHAIARNAHMLSQAKLGLQSKSISWPAKRLLTMELSEPEAPPPPPLLRGYEQDCIRRIPFTPAVGRRWQREPIHGATRDDLVSLEEGCRTSSALVHFAARAGSPTRTISAKIISWICRLEGLDFVPQVLQNRIEKFAEAVC